jgi:opacity protein-like surface antigen
MKYIAVIIMLICLSAGVYAQANFFGLTYDISIPMGDTEKAFNGAQWRGMGMEGRWYLDQNTSMGFSWDWNVFHDVRLETVEFTNGAVTGSQNRVMNAFPLLLTGQYYLEGGSVAQPYVGLGIGTYYVKQTFDLGILSTSRNSWRFGIAPEIGVLFPMDMGFNVLLKLRYNYAFESGDSKSVSYFGINLGFASIQLF